MPSKILRLLSATLMVICATTLSRAEDTRGKWQFGLGVSYWSTDDGIRSNAGTAYAPVDPSQGANLPPIIFSDPRDDSGEINEASIEDTYKLDFSASYGFTRWFAVEIGMSYFKGNVGDIELFLEERTVPIQLIRRLFDPTDPATAVCATTTCYEINEQGEVPTIVNTRIPVGEITEVPVTLSGLVRFRPESPFDPYVGAGVGYIFTSMDTSGARLNSPIFISSTNNAGVSRAATISTFNELQAFTNSLEVATIQSGARGILTFPTATSSGFRPIAPLQVNVDDGFAYHLQGGIDYFFNERWSLFIDGRYVWADSTVEVRIDNTEQVVVSIPDFGCEAESPSCRTIASDDPIPITDAGAVLFGDTIDDTSDVLLIQGGDLKLGGFSLGVGVKIMF